MAGNTKASPNAVFAGSVPYLMLAGNVVAGWQMARALLKAEDLLARGEGDTAFLKAKIATAQFYAEHLLNTAPGVRDSRILPIYEGTTAIQANDLVGRKTARDGGRTPKAIAAQIAATEADLAKRESAAAKAMAKRLHAARVAFEQVVDFVAGNTKASPNEVFAGSVPYLMLAGNVMAGWQMARALIRAEELLAKGEGDAAFLKAKVATAHFYADHLLSKAPGARDAIIEGADSVMALALDSF